MSARASAVIERPAARRTAAARASSVVRGRTELSALDGERIALPHRELLEERFGRPLDSIAVYSGPHIAATLGRMHAVSAARGDEIFLASASVPVDVVAHEVTHAVQAANGAQGSHSVEPAQSAAEREASVVAAAVSGPKPGAAPVSVGEGMHPGTLALLRVPQHRTGDELTLGPPTTATARRDLAPAPPAPAESTVTAAPATASTGSTASTAGPAAEEEAAAGFELPAAPELTVSAEEVAATEAVIAEAEAALAGATTPDAKLKAYAAAPPTVKARQAGSLGAEVADVAATESQQWQSDVPDLHASLTGNEPAAAPVPVLAPPAGPVELVEPAVAPAPEPEIADVEVPGSFVPAENAAGPLTQLSEPDPAVLAEQIGDSLDAVQTVDPAVPRSPGPPPPIPLGGETDPARVAEVESAGQAEAAGARDEAAQAVAAGPGPEVVQPSPLDEAYAVGELAAPVIGTPATPEGPAAYAAMELPPEVQVAFDEQQHAAMEQSLADSVAQSEQATSDRDAAKQSAVAEAEAGAARLNEGADGEQAAAVLAARTDIQAARQHTVDAQQREVERVEGEAGDQRRIDEEAIQTRVADDQETIDASYATAEVDIGDKVAEGERQAETKKEEAERAAEEESWWDRAVSFVKDAFNSLVDAIGAVFDAVRSAVNDILDAVKAAALAAIDAVAGFIKDAIAAYGEFLKAAITGLIGEVFPELAAALNEAIDSAVALAQSAVDVVADGLKAGMSALVDGLRAGLMAIIDAYQAAVTLALSVAAAAITGDWGALAMRVLEAVLRLIGVDPEAFYAFVGRAQETFQMIIDDPVGFLGNVLAAVTGGIQGFADRIVEHLQAGVIGWLTGALGGAGIVLPQSFDLLGVLDLARQILGLTWDLLRAKARTLIGEQNVERIEVVFGFIETLVTEGWGGLWAQIMESVSNVYDLVFEGIATFVRDRIIISAITKLASLFSPVGAVVQLVLTAWNIYTFLRDQLARIAEVVQTVTNAIGDIARGALDNAKTAVEGVLARLLPLAIDLLARVIGLGNVGAKVREIVEKVRAVVDKGIDALLQRIANAFKGGGAAKGAAAGGAGAGGAAAADAGVAAGAGTIAAKDHESYAIAAAARLQSEVVDTPGLATVRAAAERLEPILSARLEAGIGLHFAFTGGAADADDGVVEVDVVIAPNTTTKHQQLSLPGLGGAPNIGVSQPHAGQETSWTGDRLRHTTSEHIIPYAIGDALLAVIGVSRGSRKESGKFDGALTTLVIYRGAADRKTYGQGSDIALIDKFRQDAVSAGIGRDVRAGAVWAAGTGQEAPDFAESALLDLRDMIGAFRTDAVVRTDKAIIDENEEKEAGYTITNGQRRGEPVGVPTPSQVTAAAQKQYGEILAFARSLFDASEGPSALPREPTDNPKSLETVTLDELNEMATEGAFALVRGIGPILGARLLAARPFASRDDIAKVTGIGDAFMARVVG